jgi:DNA polymerase III epsilon subunit-like protein
MQKYHTPDELGAHGSEYEIYSQIDYMGAFAWRMRHEMKKGNIPESEWPDIATAIEKDSEVSRTLVRHLGRFGVRIEERVSEGKDGKKIYEYHDDVKKWVGHWSSWKGDLSAEEWDFLRSHQAEGEEVRHLMPKMTWDGKLVGDYGPFGFAQILNRISAYDKDEGLIRCHAVMKEGRDDAERFGVDLLSRAIYSELARTMSTRCSRENPRIATRTMRSIADRVLGMLAAAENGAAEAYGDNDAAKETMVFVDIETTGLDHDRCAICSIGALHPESGKGFYRTCHVDVDAFEISDAALKINGFTKEDLASTDGKMDEKEMLSEFDAWLEGLSAGRTVILAGQNVGQFDMQFLSAARRRREMNGNPGYSRRVFDLHTYAMAVTGRSLSMDELLVHLGEPAESKPHHAFVGAECARKCYDLLKIMAVSKEVASRQSP